MVLKVWNREVFDNFDRNIETTLATLTDIQKQYDKDSSFQEIFQFESIAHANLDRLLDKQDTF